MTTVKVDATTRLKLHNLNEALELIDEFGQVFGHFVPVAKPASREPQISEQEIARRLRQGGGRTLPEILADLERLS